MHLKSIYEEKELAEGATIKDFLIVQKEGNREINRKQKFYNLDVTQQHTPMYYERLDCQAGQYFADEWLGVTYPCRKNKSPDGNRKIKSGIRKIY